MTTKLTQFESQHLNELGAELIDLYQSSNKHLEKARENVNKAIINRFNCGKLIHDNYEHILKECGTQRFFAEEIGQTEAKVSNDLRGYKAALENGIETEQQLLEFLRQRKINPTTRNWEKLPTLLNEPESHREEDRRHKDTKRLEELLEEADEIAQRHINTKQLKEEAEETVEHINSIGSTMIQQDPTQTRWKSEAFLDIIRNFGMDMVTGEAVPEEEKLEPHHIDPVTGEAGGGIAEKVSDVFTLPVLPRTHREIHENQYSKERLRIALIKTLAIIITNAE